MVNRLQNMFNNSPWLLIPSSSPPAQFLDINTPCWLEEKYLLIKKQFVRYFCMVPSIARHQTMKLKRERKKVSLERSTTDISYCVLLVFLFLLLLYYSLLFFDKGSQEHEGGFCCSMNGFLENDFGHFCFINAISKNCFSEHFDIFRFWYIMFSSVRICSFSVSIRVGFFRSSSPARSR